MKVTKKMIERALILAGVSDKSNPITVEKTYGVYYFYGGDAFGWYSTCSYFVRLDDATLEEWVYEAAMLASGYERFDVDFDFAVAGAEAAVEKYRAAVAG